MTRPGFLHRIAEVARSMSAPLKAEEIRQQISAAPALGQVLDDVIAEAIWPHERPLRVPDLNHRQ